MYVKLTKPQQVDELSRLKQDLTLQEKPAAAPPVPTGTRPGGAAVAAPPPAPAGLRAKALYDYEVGRTVYLGA